MRHTGFRAYVAAPPVPKMPLGLLELLEGLAKDVLKNNPGEPEMLNFCANHMKKLLEIRDGKEPKRAKMSLEEKIKKVQERVRKLAEQRRQDMADIEASVSSKSSLHESSTNNAKTDSIENISSAVLESPVPTEKAEILDEKTIGPQEINPNADIHVSVFEEPMKDVTTREFNEIETKLSTDDSSKIKETIERVVCDQKVSESNENESLCNEIPVNVMSENFPEPLSSLSFVREEIGGKNNIELNDTENIRNTEHESKGIAISVNQKDDENNVNVDTDISINSTSVLNDVHKSDNDTVHNTPNDECANEMYEEPLNADVEIDAIDTRRQPSEKNDSEEKNNSDECMHCSKDIPDDPLITPSTTSMGRDGSREQNSNDAQNVYKHAVDFDEHTVEPDKLTSRNEPQLIETINLQNKEYLLVCNSASEEDVVELEPDFIIENDKESVPSHISGDINTDNTLEDIDSNSETITELDIRSEEEEKHHGMDLETAAVTIQKLFRSYLFKSRTSTLDDFSNEEDGTDLIYQMEEQTPEESESNREEELNAIKERRAAGLTRMDTVLQTVNEEKSLSVSTDDSSTLSSAATIIQAHVRGFLVRNRRHSSKTISNTSLINSAANSASFDAADPNKGKTILNIHIVPEVDNHVTRDESITTSIDLPFDGSPPPSTGNLHPLSHDVSERRKQLKREDAIQSMSPPSNNSGKLSEDVDSIKDASENGKSIPVNTAVEHQETKDESLSDATPSHSATVKTVIEVKLDEINKDNNSDVKSNEKNITNQDERDVVTPHSEGQRSLTLSDATSRLVHSSEFHDIVLPTNVSRGKSTVVRGE